MLPLHTEMEKFEERGKWDVEGDKAFGEWKRENQPTGAQVSQQHLSEAVTNPSLCVRLTIQSLATLAVSALAQKMRHCRLS